MGVLRLTFAALLWSSLGLGLVSTLGCGDLRLTSGDGQTAPPVRETVFAIDGVKLISKTIQRGNDDQTYTQPVFTLSTDSRLLLRYEALMTAKSAALTDYPFRLRIFATSAEDRARGIQTLKVCPVTKSWMMAATWDAAHPWRGGGWTAGGAIDLDECVSAEAATASVSPTVDGTSSASISKHCTEPNAICFDVSRWYRVWVMERNENYGLAIVAKEPVSIVGDAVPSRAPRIHWFEPENKSTLGWKRQ